MGHTGFINQNKIRKRHYDKHKRLGLCVDCSNKIEFGKLRCRKHLDYCNMKNKECQQRKEELKSNLKELLK